MQHLRSRGTATGRPRQPGAPAGAVVWLDDPVALDPSVSGAKAAALARAAAEGFDVVPGFAVTVPTTPALAVPVGPLDADVATPLRRAWTALSDHGTVPLVVRSSSTAEDGETSSMAGRFTSVLDVRDWRAFRDALARVVASARLPDGQTVPMAVLVQRQLDARRGGVLFGVDPVTARDDRMVVAVVDGGPDALVSGQTSGDRLVLTHSGRLVDGPAVLSLRQRVELARLGRRASSTFGGPQDVEWAHDGDGALWLLQSRPVTAIAARGSGPILGQGPLAETFPDALSTLERELWLEPLRAAVVAALRTAGTAGRALERSPVVTSVRGRVVGDLRLLGVAPRKRSLWRALDPRPAGRRLRAAWRMGQLRVLMPQRAARTVRRTDAALARVPHPSQMADGELLDLLASLRAPLTRLHTDEILTGFLLRGNVTATSAAAVALHALAAGREEGLGDEKIIARAPVVLALSPPAVGPPRPLPEKGMAPDPDRAVAPDPLAIAREALRLRARLVQELMARVAWELAGRLADDHTSRGDVRWLRMNELQEAVGRGAVPDDLGSREVATDGPLPAAFRLAGDGRIIPVDQPRRGSADGGVGAGGGYATGPVHNGTGTPAQGSVLVVRTLDPALATVLPGLGGLVSETGSVLSHLAILAREYGVPTVVGLAGALDRFPHGTHVAIDGTSGEVRLVESAR